MVKQQRKIIQKTVNKRAAGKIFFQWKMRIGMVLFPQRCPACGQVLERDLFVLWEDMFPEQSRNRQKGPAGNRKRNPWFCDGCQGKWKVIREPFCKKCGKKLRKAEAEYCTDCRKIRHLFQKNRALWEYGGSVKEMLHRFKYSGCTDYAEAIGWELSCHFGEWIKKEGIQVVIPVPLHRTRRRKRGYNQAEKLADALARRSGLDVNTKLVYRSRNTRPQMSLSAAERKNNLKRAFKSAKNIVQLDKVLVIDDIFTTGSTLDAVSDVLKQAGIKEIYCISAGIGKND